MIQGIISPLPWWCAYCPPKFSSPYLSQSKKDYPSGKNGISRRRRTPRRHGRRAGHLIRRPRPLPRCLNPHAPILRAKETDIPDAECGCRVAPNSWGGDLNQPLLPYLVPSRVICSILKSSLYDAEPLLFELHAHPSSGKLNWDYSSPASLEIIFTRPAVRDGSRPHSGELNVLFYLHIGFVFSFLCCSIHIATG